MRKFLLFVLLGVSVAAQAQPVINSFSPVSAVPGAQVIITGTGFGNTAAENIVFFGATRASVVTASSSSITVNVPQGATYAPVTVLNTNSFLLASSAARFNPAYSASKPGFDTTDLFKQPDIASSGVNPTAVLAGDMDGDGKTDLVIINSDNSNIAVLLNNSTGETVSFAIPVLIGTSGNPFTGSLADLDGDGKLDIAFTELNNNYINVLLNKSTPGNVNIGPASYTWPGGSTNNGNILVPANGNRPMDVAIADIDSDGKNDLIVTNTNSNTVVIFLNTTGTGSQLSFSPAATLSTGVNTGPFDLRINDLDKDGKPDLVIGYQFTNTNISIFRNTSTTGTVSFDPRIDLAAGTNAYGVAVGDLDGDGKADIVSSNFNTNTLSVYHNNSTVGTISFSAKSDIPNIGSPSYGLSMADMNGDGKADLVVANVLSNTVSVLVNTSSLGSISFMSPVKAATATGPAGLATADFNGDGQPDIVVANTGSASISIFRNHVNKVIAPPAVSSATPMTGVTGTRVTITGSNFTEATGVSFGGVAATSFSVVSSTSIVATVGAGATGSISVTNIIGSSGIAGFTYVQLPVVTSFFPTAAVSGTAITITGNNFNSLIGVSFGGTAAASFTLVSSTTINAIVGAGSSGAVRVVFSAATVTLPGFNYGAAPVITSLSPASAIPGAQVTITGTGFSSNNGGNVVYFGATRANVVSSGFSSVTVTVPHGATYGPVSLLNVDYFLLAKSNTNFNPVFSALKTGFDTTDLARQPDVATAGTNPTAVLAGDMDGDGRTDLVIINSDNSNIAVMLNTSTGETISFAAPILIGASGNPFTGSLGDLDGDGKLDIAFTQLNSNNIHVLLNKSTPGNLNIGPVSYTWPAGSANNGNVSINSNGNRPMDLATVDIDGDGKNDIVVTNTNSNTVVAFLNTTSTGSQLSFSPVAVLSTGGNTGPFDLRVADLDKDGKPDLVIGYQFTNTNISIFRNTSTSGAVSFDTRIDLAAGTNPYGVAVGDLDGDGKPDIVSSNFNSNSLSVYHNNSTVGTISFSAKTDIPNISSPSYGLSITDMNGDGKPDLVVPNVLSNTVSVLVNTSSVGSFSFMTPVKAATAVGPAGLAAADLNGDGQPDLVVTNTGSASLSIFKNHVNKVTAPPAVSSATPMTGVTGTRVTITGSNFVEATSVSFGGRAATAFTVVSPTSIIATVGLGATGSISVTNIVGTAGIAGFVYIPQPLVLSFSPTSGGTGTVVAIQGGSFTGVSGVSFGGTAASAFTVTSSETIVATVGAGASGSVSVTNGTLNSSLAGFTFVAPIPAPIVKLLIPQSGRIGSSVIIKGKNFSSSISDNIVFFGAVKAVVTAATDSTITVTVPAGASYDPLSVTVKGLTGYSLIPFNVMFDGGNKSFTSSSFIKQFTLPAIPQPDEVKATDLDLDGKVDIVAGSALTNKISIYRNLGATGKDSLSTKIDLEIPSAIGISGIITPDINGDGKPDIIVSLYTNYGGNTLAIFRNTSTPGNISFAPRIDSVLGNASAAIAFEDVDGDGKIDIVARLDGSSNDVSLAVLKNTSHGDSIAFGTRLLIPVDFTNAPSSIIIKDLDGDRKPDIVVSNNNSNNRLYVFRNTTANGVISFDAPTNLELGTYPLKIATGDINGDNIPDLIVLNSYVNRAGSVSVLRNLSTPGNIQFATKVSLPLGVQPFDMSMGDMDGDGRIDIVASIRGTTSGSLSFLRNISTATNISFDTAVSYTISSSMGLGVADLNLDNRPDVIVASTLDQSVYIYMNQIGAPKLTSFSPTSGRKGDTIYIKGTTLSAVSAVSFGGTAATSFTVSSDSLLVAIVGDGTSGNITVTGNSATTTISGFIYIPKLVPAVSSFTPATGGNGTVVTIKGRNFKATNAVRFGNTLASAYTVLADTLISATVGKGAGGYVYVSAPDGADSLSGFGFISPQISVSSKSISFNASNGSYSPVQSYLVGGNYLWDTLEVKVNAGHLQISTKADTGFTNSIKLVPQKGVIAQTPIYVRFRGDNTLTTYNDSIYHYTTSGETIKVSTSGIYASPALSSYTPNSGGYGTEVTIRGKNLAKVSTVTFGGVAANSFNIQSDTVMTAIVGKGGTGSVYVSNVNGADSMSSFTFLTPTIAISNNAFTFPVANGSYSKPQSYTVTGRYMWDTLVVKVNPGHLQISTKSDTGYTNLLKLVPVNGTATATVYARFKGDNTLTSFDDSIYHTFLNAIVLKAGATGVYCDTILNFTPQVNNIKADSLICFKDQVVLGLTNGAASYPVYRWSTGETTATRTVDKTTTVTLQVGSSATCLSNPSIPIRLVKNLNTAPTITISGDNRLSSSAAPAYRWYFNNKLSGDTIPAITASKIGFYKVETSLDRSCWDASSEVAIVIASAPLVNDTLKVIVYPNPVTAGTTFYVVGTLQRVTNVVAKLTVADVSGNAVVQSSKLIFFGKEIKIPLLLQNKGTYFIKLDINGDVKTQTIIIQ